MKTVIRVIALVSLTALVACGQPMPLPQVAPASIKGTATAVTPAGTFVPVGAALILADPAVTTTSLETLAGPVEAAPGLYVGAMAVVDADGKFELTLPDWDDMPAGLTAPAAQFFKLPGAEACVLTASVPGAQVSKMVFFFGPLAAPGVLLLSIEGVALSIATPTPVDFADPAVKIYDQTLLSWLHTDADVNISTPPGGCAVGTQTVTIDLALTEGWNQVASTFEADSADTLLGTNVTNNASEDVYVFPALF